MSLPPPIPSSPDRLRYLAAMGIDVWIRRQRGEDVPASAPADRVQVGAESEAFAGTGGREEGVRALLEAVDDSAASATARSTEAPSPVAPGTDPAAESAPSAAGEPDAGPDGESAAPGPVPRFRLRVLGLGSGMLLVDEAAVEAAPRASLQRLGDLLRAGCLLRQAPTKGKVESQTFFWPQLDVPDVDQSLPRAVEALSAFVRRRAAAEGFFLILVEPATGLLDHDAGEPLRALDVLPVTRARIDAGFLTDPGPEAGRAAWNALLRMVGAGVTEEVRRDD